MVSWKLKVEDYGKIKYAEMEIAPLTLFVGDNNSGKSYLLSLLWGIQNLGVTELMGGRLEEKNTAERVLMDWIDKQIKYTWENGVQDICLCEIEEQLQAALQEGLDKNKNRLLKKIFNSSAVKIRKLTIELPDLKNHYVRFICSKQRDKDESGSILTWGIMTEGAARENLLKNDSVAEDGLNENTAKKTIYYVEYSGKDRDELNEYLLRIILYIFLGLMIGIPFDDTGSNRKIYLPAARTGFMLTKDIINKAGRKTAFNLEMEQEKFSPFTRPINQFLDVMNDLVIDGKGNEQILDIVEYLENGMADGSVEMSMLPNKEVLYFPSGRKKGIPLRVVSAVVTELSPLILILKHKKSLDTLFYEEPEMCLHPQLQQKMARVICQLSNAGLGMMVTTHSDIILQHINNMIRLSEKENAKELCRQLGYTSRDLLEGRQVKVYQFKVNSRGKTEVEELFCGRNGFAIPTFNDALDKIMDEAYLIQGQD